MLILTRKKKEAIQFPDLSITVEILEASPGKVRVGVEAPVEVRIVRDELAGGEGAEPAEKRVLRMPAELRHDLKNELNLISLGLHVFKKKVDRGLEADYQLSFEELVQRLQRIANHGALASHINQNQIYTEGNSLTALVVEDCDNERELLSGFLDLHGFSIASVASAEAALEFLENNPPPKAILLDMQLPELQGADLLKQIRQSEQYNDTLLFVISGTTPEDNKLSEADGMDEWFEKPIDPRKLVSRLRQIPVQASGEPTGVSNLQTN